MNENEIIPEEVTRNLQTRFIGQKLIYFSRTDSTMDKARQEARWGAAAGTVIIAGEQTAGRGRLQREWVSPAGGLAISVILRPNLNHLSYMNMLASLAVCFAIEKVTGRIPRIKWPNDVLISEKKVSGILIENDIHKLSLKYSVIGIGINVNMDLRGYPRISSSATSLSDETGRFVSKLALVRNLLVEMDSLYSWIHQGEKLFQEWKGRLSTLGQYVRLTQEDRSYTGYAESVSQDGTLILRKSDGQLMKVVAGDISLRPINPELLTE